MEIDSRDVARLGGRRFLQQMRFDREAGRYFCDGLDTAGDNEIPDEDSFAGTGAHGFVDDRPVDTDPDAAVGEQREHRVFVDDGSGAGRRIES